LAPTTRHYDLASGQTMHEVDHTPG